MTVKMIFPAGVNEFTGADGATLVKDASGQVSVDANKIMLLLQAGFTLASFGGG